MSELKSECTRVRSDDVLQSGSPASRLFGTEEKPSAAAVKCPAATSAVCAMNAHPVIPEMSSKADTIQCRK